MDPKGPSTTTLWTLAFDISNSEWFRPSVLVCALGSCWEKVECTVPFCIEVSSGAHGHSKGLKAAACAEIGFSDAVQAAPVFRTP